MRRGGRRAEEGTAGGVIFAVSLGEAFGVESLPECGEGFEGEGFGAGFGIDGGAVEGAGGGSGGKAGGAEVVGEGFSFLREGAAEEGKEAGFIDGEFCKARRETPAEDRGVDLGRRDEGRGRQREERFDGAVHLDGRGEHAIVAGAGGGGDAVGDFALDHEDGAVDGGVGGGDVKQDGRGDVVREIAGDGETRSACYGGEVEVEDALLDDGDAAGCVGSGRELGAEVGGEFGVELDGEDAGGAGGERGGDGAFAGADFDDGGGAEIAEGGGDALDGAGIAEEVLAEFGFGGHGHL